MCKLKKMNSKNFLSFPITMSIDPEDTTGLCEKSKLLTPKQFYLRFCGNFTYRRHKGARTVNHIIIPKDEEVIQVCF